MMQLKAETETAAAAVHSERIAWWVQLIVVLGALLTAAGAVIAIITQPCSLRLAMRSTAQPASLLDISRRATWDWLAF